MLVPAKEKNLVTLCVTDTKSLFCGCWLCISQINNRVLTLLQCAILNAILGQKYQMQHASDPPSVPLAVDFMYSKRLPSCSVAELVSWYGSRMRKRRVRCSLQGSSAARTVCCFAKRKCEGEFDPTRLSAASTIASLFGRCCCY